VTNAAIGQFVSDVNTSRNSVNQQINDVKEDKLAQNARYAASVGKVGGSPIGGSPPSNPGAKNAVGRTGNSNDNEDKCQCGICQTPATCRCGETTHWGLTAVSVGQFFDRDECQGIWISPIDAKQRPLGYNDLWDFGFEFGELITSIFPAFNVTQDIFCSEFKIAKTYWRIEAWKGNYMNMGVGAEIGIYYNTSGGKHYKAAESGDQATMYFTLKHGSELLFSRGPMRHWWLTGFRPGIGTISKSELAYEGYARFSDLAQAKAFGNQGNLKKRQGNLNIWQSNPNSKTVEINWY
jgi:hypothetical protein